MQRLIYNLTGQTLTHVPDARRASATWRLEDLLRDVSDGDRLLDDGSVNVDTATEAITADAGPTEVDSRSVSVASTTGFVVGHTYEIVSATGDRELVRLSGLVTDADLVFEHALLGTYPSGSTVRGVELVTAAIDPLVLQDEQRVVGDWPMRIVWTYPDGSRYQEGVRIVREDRHDQLVAAVIRDIRDTFPDVDTRMERHGRDTLMPHVSVALRQFRGDLLTRGIRAEELLAGDKAHWAIVWRVLWHLARLGNAPATGDGSPTATEWAEYCRAEYEKFWQSLMVGQGGPEVLPIEPVSSTAPASTDDTYRRVIMDL